MGTTVNWCTSHTLLQPTCMVWLQISTQLLAPIAPHTCDHVWRALLKLPGSCLNSGWPKAPAPDAQLKAMEQYLAKTVKGVRDLADKAVLPPKAKKGKAPQHQPQQVDPLPTMLRSMLWERKSGCLGPGKACCMRVS